METNKSGHKIRVARTMQVPLLTQDDLAAKMQLIGFTKLSKNTISRIEIGDRYVTDVELIGFAKVLGVTTSWLLGETDNPY